MNPYLKNWLVSPLLWGVWVWVGGYYVFGVEFDWRVWGVCVWACVVESMIDSYLEGRPIEGPRRWRR